VLDGETRSQETTDATFHRNVSAHSAYRRSE
jgi:hypothetical protein